MPIDYHSQTPFAVWPINDGMDKFTTHQTIKQAPFARSCFNDAKISVLGLTFKENCGDLATCATARPSISSTSCRAAGVGVFVTNPAADAEEAMHGYEVKLVVSDDPPSADALFAEATHKEYAALSIENLGRKMVKMVKVVTGGTFMDVAAARSTPFTLTGAGYRPWRL